MTRTSRFSCPSCTKTIGKDVSRMTKSLAYVGVLVLVVGFLLTICVGSVWGAVLLTDQQMGGVIGCGNARTCTSGWDKCFWDETNCAAGRCSCPNPPCTCEDLELGQYHTWQNTPVKGCGQGYPWQDCHETAEHMDDCAQCIEYEEKLGEACVGPVQVCKDYIDSCP